MRRAPRSIIALFALVSLTVVLTPAFAEELNTSAAHPKGWVATQVPKQTCGWQLMSDVERQSYRIAMQSLKTPEERDRMRKSIHEAMKARAHERELTLPDEPSARPGIGYGCGCAGAQGFRHGRVQPTT